jgi:hypothetical protein
LRFRNDIGNKDRTEKRKIQTKKQENFRVFSAEKGGISKKAPLFLKIFAEKFWYYENTIYLCNVKIKLLTNQTPTAMATTNNIEMRIKFIEAMSIVKVSTEMPKTKEYRLRYFFGTWMTSSIIFAESDAEAIFDADEVYNENGNLADWQYPVALFCGNRKVKVYNNRSIYGK